MRQFILVVVLVGSAFLGGAFVNGPGLQWAQSKVLRSLSLSNAGEISSIDLKPATGPDELVPIKPEADTMQAPIAPVPSVLAENEPSEDHGSNRPSASQMGSKFDSSDPKSPGSERSSPPSPMKRFPPVTKAFTPKLAPSDPDVAPAGATVSPAIEGSPSLPGPKAAPALLDTLAALLPAAPPSPGDSAPTSPLSTAPPAPSRKAIGEGNEHWAVLERNMQSVGVSRYTVEGEPGGRVVFSCLIPVVGRHAVTQRFEAEGDDLVQAARAALRRIALWRAAQPSAE